MRGWVQFSGDFDIRTMEGSHMLVEFLYQWCNGGLDDDGRKVV
jgi:hypothetical protein